MSETTTRAISQLHNTLIRLPSSSVTSQDAVLRPSTILTVGISTAAVDVRGEDVGCVGACGHDYQTLLPLAIHIYFILVQGRDLIRSIYPKHH